MYNILSDQKQNLWASIAIIYHILTNLDRQTDRQTDRDSDSDADSETDRQTDRQLYSKQIDTNINLHRPVFFRSVYFNVKRILGTYNEKGSKFHNYSSESLCNNVP